MNPNTDVEKLEAQFTAASKAINTGKVGDKGAEQKYADAYNQLVQAGLRPKLRGKYRAR